jgi:hypothetical protein
VGSSDASGCPANTDVDIQTRDNPGVVDSMNNWKRRGSFSLPPLQGVLPLMS